MSGDHIDQKKKVQMLVSARLDSQIESVDSFVTRGSLVLATCGVIFTGYMQFMTSPFFSAGYIPLILIEVLFIFAAGFFAFRSITAGTDGKRWRYDPSPRKLHELIKEEQVENFDEVVTEAMIDSYEHNKKLLADKFKLLSTSKHLMCLSAIVFILHLLILV